MRVIALILLLFPLLAPLKVHAMVDPSTSAPISTANLELLLERAMSENLIDGGVVLVGNRDGILATAARGKVSPATGAAAITDRTVFDVASLTKVIATTPAVIKLLDEGRISLTDTLSRWFPELAGSDKGNITILHLMTHTSGLADIMVGQDRSFDTVLRKVAAQRSRGAGTGFDYADINFIILGELVHRVSGERLDRFCLQQIYQPLGTRDTTFLPARDGAAEIAPTSGSQGGVVQDENARRLGGVAGHAGLFSTAYDLARFARFMLGHGALDGNRILSEQAVTQMTTPYLCNNGSVKRGLGWDMASPFSAPKGNYFSDASFGHTGYSGSSIWIDPQQDMYVIMLTRRSDYRNVRNFNQLRRNVSTYAAADLGGGAGMAPVAEVEQIKAQVILASAAALQQPRRSKAASLKWREERRAAKCSVKKGRHVLQARAGHRGGKVSKLGKLARNEAQKVRSSAKKRHSLARS